MRLEYPIVEAIKSVLPLVDEMVVNVGRSGDGTLDMIRREFSGKPVTVLDREWDASVGGAVLAGETNFAMRHSVSDWVVYVQADEVLHEKGIPRIRECMTKHLDEDRVQGLLVEFVHHYGLPELVATSRTWYRREVRIVKTISGAESYHEAQGFRVGGKPIRAVRSGATYHHYGWLRSCAALEQKSEADFRIYGRKEPRSFENLPWEYGLREFSGRHPGEIDNWFAEMDDRFPGVGDRFWTLRQVRMLISDLVERSIGRKIFEYRNYVEF